MCSFQVYAGTSTVANEAFRGCPQSLQPNAMIVTRLHYDRFLLSPFHFIIHPTVELYVIDAENAVKHPLKIKQNNKICKQIIAYFPLILYDNIENDASNSCSLVGTCLPSRCVANDRMDTHIDTQADERYL
jgi:hypothetical protein